MRFGYHRRNCEMWTCRKMEENNLWCLRTTQKEAERGRRSWTIQ